MGALSNLLDDSRSKWGARAPEQRIYTVPVTQKDYFVNHWDGGDALGLAGKPHSACLARVKSDQNFHMGPSRQWADIGYNALICPHGRAIEGRGLLTVAAHCPGYNSNGVGVQFMVGGDDPLPDVMLNRARELYDDLAKLGGPTHKMGHSDGYPTECPGSEILAWVRRGMPLMGSGAPLLNVPGKPSEPVVQHSVAPGPHYPFPLPSGHWFGKDDGTERSVSGHYPSTFKGRKASAWIQQFGSQLTRRGWSVGRGKQFLGHYGNDGQWGEEYDDLCRAFQEDQELKVDGKCGAATWRAAFENPIS